MIRNCCAISCDKTGTFRCGRCKQANYCSVEHQKLDWKLHKKNCKNEGTPSSLKFDRFDGDSKYAKKANLKDDNSESVEEKRSCRCMFCGEQLILASEKEAIEHMRHCPALQEQLESKDQFTIPSAIREKVAEKEG
mmetsp:Transcript_17220/g.29149  ORF Transcript_17220/g.29149 Transcript_17220/m.29149 type:complete len:136 (+) Transcript_17220:215-622(+)